jgi:uncharacterized HAD superfamily protein
MTTFCVDVDGTLCSITTNQEYYKAIPYKHRIKKVNQLYECGHIIKIFTARGMASGKLFEEITRQQLQDWGVKYHELVMGKPSADYYVDDKCLTPEQFAAMAV